MRCRKCGNDQLFISEAWFLHWVKIDGSGKVRSVDGRQGDTETHLELDGNEHVECHACGSTDIEKEY